MKNAPGCSKSIWAIVRDAGNQWMEDNALRLSAALAYYSIFSIAPLLVIAMAIAGRILGHDAAQGLLNEQLRGVFGDHAAMGIEGMVQSASQPSASIVAGIAGAVTILVGASGVFGELKDALNTIWEVRLKPGQGIMRLVRDRLWSFGMVLVIGFLLLISLLLTTGLAALAKYFGTAFPVSAELIWVCGFILSFAVITVLFAAIFKILPDAKVHWREVWIGAVVTAFLFEIGKYLLGFYLGRASTASAYGAAASVVLVLLWIYYASLILLFGAEFTQVYARACGSRIEPSANAERMLPEQRAQEGMEPVTARHLASPPDRLVPPRESPRHALGISTAVARRTASAVGTRPANTGSGKSLSSKRHPFHFPWAIGLHMKLSTIEDLFHHELKDLHSAESQLVKALPKMAKAASNEELQAGFEEHLEQTKGHVERLEQIGEILGKKLGGHKCKAMEGLIEEGSELISEDAEDAVRDAGLIGAAQRVEHYEIAGYGTAIALASALGQNEAVSLLKKTLQEEKDTDAKLTQLAESSINPSAASAGE
jgi:membrane protein